MSASRPACPSCGEAVATAATSQTGKPARCPECGAALRVTGPSGEDDARVAPARSKAASGASRQKVGDASRSAQAPARCPQCGLAAPPTLQQDAKTIRCEGCGHWYVPALPRSAVRRRSNIWAALAVIGALGAVYGAIALLFDPGYLFESKKNTELERVVRTHMGSQFSPAEELSIEKIVAADIPEGSSRTSVVRVGFRVRNSAGVQVYHDVVLVVRGGEVVHEDPRGKAYRRENVRYRQIVGRGTIDLQYLPQTFDQWLLRWRDQEIRAPAVR